MSFTITIELLLVKNIVFFIQKKKSITHSNTIDRLFRAQRMINHTLKNRGWKNKINKKHRKHNQVYLIITQLQQN